MNNFFYKSVLGFPYSSNALKLKTVNWLCVEDLFYAGKVTFKSSLQVFHSQNILCCNDCTYCTLCGSRNIILDEQLLKKERQCMGLDSCQSTTTTFCFRYFHRPVTSLWEYKCFSKKKRDYNSLQSYNKFIKICCGEKIAVAS